MNARPPALLMIAFQNDFFPGGAVALGAMEAAARRGADLLATFRSRGWPRFHVQHVAMRAGSTHFLPGTPGVEFHEALCPEGDEAVVVKHFSNSFRDTTLHDDLWECGAGELVICGATSDSCVEAAARHAVDFGFPVTVIHDACAARPRAFDGRAVPAEDVHAACMATLAAHYGRVASFDEWRAGLAPEAVAA